MSTSGSEQSPEVDRRVRRTRRALQGALIELALARGYESLTIEDITERADVGRTTFYLHFAEKHDLLMSVADDIMDELMADLRALQPIDHGTVVRTAFAHAEANPNAYRLVLSGAGDGRALQRTLALAAEYGETMIAQSALRRGATLRIPLKTIARIWSGELVMAMHWWTCGESGYSAAEVAEFLLLERFYGLAWVYGSDPGDPTLASQELTAAQSGQEP